MDSKGAVGSVHTPGCYLRVAETEIPEDVGIDFEVYRYAKYSRTLSSSRVNMKICGGQGYHPVLKSNTLCEQRHNLETLAYLPLLLQRLLTSPKGSFDEAKSEITAEVIEKFCTLEALLQNQNNEWRNSGKNTVRFEFYVTSTLRNARCDIVLPVPNPWNLISTVDHEPFKQSWSDYTTLYMTPLSNFVEELKDIEKRNGRDDLLHSSALSPAIRTTLVFCAEKCVQAVNIIGFQGKITKMLWKELQKQAHYPVAQPYFVIPASALVTVEESGSQRFALRMPRIVLPTGLVETPNNKDEAPSGTYTRHVVNYCSHEFSQPLFVHKQDLD